jgi:hypothetical protein
VPILKGGREGGSKLQDSLLSTQRQGSPGAVMNISLVAWWGMLACAACLLLAQLGNRASPGLNGVAAWKSTALPLLPARHGVAEWRSTALPLLPARHGVAEWRSTALPLLPARLPRRTWWTGCAAACGCRCRRAGRSMWTPAPTSPTSPTQVGALRGLAGQQAPRCRSEAPAAGVGRAECALGLVRSYYPRDSASCRASPGMFRALSRHGLRHVSVATGAAAAAFGPSSSSRY